MTPKTKETARKKAEKNRRQGPAGGLLKEARGEGRRVPALVCKECGRRYEPKPIYNCEFCFGPLECAYDYSAIRRSISRKKIEAGPPTLWRYRDLLPVESEEPVTLHEGFTPLIHARNLGKELGLDNLYLKNDCVNPTYSFKDRVVSVAVTKLKEFGFDTVSCASTGNLACAVSAYGSVAGLRTVVFIPSDLETGKIVAAGIYQPTIVGIEGNYDQVNRLCAEVAERFRWAFVNVNLRPYYAEGSKTLGFEVAEQLGWRAPDHCIVPVASGSLLVKIHKGLLELERVGLIGKFRTRMTAAQPEGCSPVVKAIREGNDVIEPVHPKTIVKSLAIGNPADGLYAAETVRATGGFGAAVSDEEVVEAIELLARTEGIFAETAGGVTVAALRRLAQEKKLGRREVIVAFITGNGLKTQEAVTNGTAKPHHILPNLKSFQNLLETIQRR